MKPLFYDKLQKVLIGHCSGGLGKARFWSFSFLTLSGDFKGAGVVLEQRL